MKFSKSLLFILATLLLLSPFQSLAFTKDQRFQLERQTYYDPTDCVVSSAPATGGGGGGGGPASPGQTWFMGDSLTYGLKDFGDLEAKLTAAGFTPNQVNDRGGRAITSDGGGGPGQEAGNGLEAVENDAEFIKGSKNVVIALGTNDGNIAGGTKDQIISSFGKNHADLIGRVKALAPNAKIFWVDIAAVGINKAGAEAINTVIYQKAQELGYTPISQFKYVWGDDQDPLQIASKNLPDPKGLLSTDGVHYAGGTKYQEYATFLANALKSGGGSTSTTVSSPRSACSCQAGGPSGSTVLTGSDNAQKIFNYFIGQGLTPIQTAGIMGNLKAESGFRPDIIQGGATAAPDYTPVNGVGFGLAQWTFTGRQQPLVDFAKSQSKPVTDLGVQLDYIWQELNTGYKKSVFDPLKASSTLEEATYLILEKYEIPADIPGNKPIRLGFANGVLDLYGGGTSSVTVGGSGSSSGSCGNTVAASGDASVRLQIAQQELAGGANETDNSYHKYTMGRSEPWCADFISWVLKEAGVPFTGGNDGWNIPSVNGVQQFLETNGKWHPKGQGFEPQPGDIVVYNEGKSPYPSHVNFILSVDGDGKFTTIGGNEGDKVSQNTHNSFDADYITGYGRVSK